MEITVDLHPVPSAPTLKGENEMNGEGDEAPIPFTLASWGRGINLQLVMGLNYYHYPLSSILPPQNEQSSAGSDLG